MISAALRLVAAVSGGAHLAGRPRSGVLHVYAGPLTPSGRFAAAAGRTVCRARTRRLTVLEPTTPGLDLRGRRVCRRCMPLLPAALGRADAADLGLARSEWLDAYSHLTVADVRQAALWCRTVDETHQVGRVATMLHGEKPRGIPSRLTPAQAAVRDLHEAIERRRKQLVAAARTDEERALVALGRELDDVERRRMNKARSDEAARDRVREKNARGQYLTPWERRLVS